MFVAAYLVSRMAGFVVDSKLFRFAFKTIYINDFRDLDKPVDLEIPDFIKNRNLELTILRA